jgi:pimeloyl-ACP methyl ester carboxylesterase
MSRFVRPLVAAGYQVVTFDAPAHGVSPGTQTDMMEFASVLRAISTRGGDLEAVVAHSFGAACTLIAIRDYRFVPKTLVLISCPPNGIWVTEQFGRTLNVSAGVLREMRSLLEARYPGKLSWSSLSMVDMVSQLSTPVLLIHDKKDRMVPYCEAAEVFTRQIPDIPHLATDGFGHKRILMADVVVESVVAFIKGGGEGRQGVALGTTSSLPPPNMASKDPACNTDAP